MAKTAKAIDYGSGPLPPSVVYIDKLHLWRIERHLFNTRLDQVMREREKADTAALADALAKHDKVREGVELFLQRYERAKEAKKNKSSENEEKIVQAAQELKDQQAAEEERSRQAKADEELAARKREKEEAQRVRQRQEAERKAAENAARVRAVAAVAAQEAEKRAKEPKAEKRTKESEAEKRAKESEAVEAAQARVVAEQMEDSEMSGVRSDDEQMGSDRMDEDRMSDDLRAGEQTRVEQHAPPSGAVHAPMNIDPLHQAYLDIHERLKGFRKSLIEYGRTNRALKEKIGNTRREIRKSVGQLVEGKGANKIPIANISQAMRAAREDTLSPPVDVRQFLLPEPLHAITGRIEPVGPELPSLFVYAMNILAKSCVAQFILEASVKPKAAIPVGICAVQFLAIDRYRWGERALTEILLAKFHVHCPVLFGIYGDPNTDEGKALLGWARVEKGGPWVSEQRHIDRMTGLGAGFAAIGLRNFSKSTMKSPFPTRHYWQAMQRIVTVPGDQVTRTHFLVLKAMIEHHEQKFIEAYGSAAVAMMRYAVINFPRTAIEVSAEAGAVVVLLSAMKKNKHFHLEDSCMPEMDYGDEAGEILPEIYPDLEDSEMEDAGMEDQGMEDA